MCQVLSPRKSVTFSCVEKGLVFERGWEEKVGEGSVSMERKRSNERSGRVGDSVEGPGFGRLAKLDYRI